MGPEETKQGREPLGRTLGRWLAVVAPVAALLASVEILLGVLAFPAMASSPATVAASWLVACGVLATSCLPVVVGLGLVERVWPASFRPTASTVASLATSVVVTAWVARVGVEVVETRDLEFRRAELMTLAVLAGSVVGLLLHHRVISPGVLRLLQAAPRLDEPRWVLAVAGSIAALTLLGVHHFVLAPIHQVPMIRWSGMLVLALATLAARVLAARLGAATARALCGIGAVLVVAWPAALASRPAVAFVAFAHTPTVAALASRLLAHTDLDDDGSIATWLGGADCAEGDPGRGPLVLEVLGDGIDQDCRGGDAEARPPVTPAAPWPDCRLADAPLSVLMLTVDALRADVLTPVATPALAHLASQSARFAQAYPPSSMTSPTFLSVFAGQALADLNRHNVLTDPELHVERTLAERYAAAGYQTIGYSYFLIHSDTTRGFAEQNPHVVDYDPRGAKHQLMAAALTNGILESVEKAADRPFFLWAHYPDAHAPYTFLQAEGAENKTATTAYLKAIRYVDAHVGRLLSTLAKAGRLERTIVVVSADHGEQLGERLREGHGPYLFEEGIRVPLLFFVPGCPPRVVEHPVNLARIGPTLAPFTRVAAPGTPWFAPHPELPVVVEDSGQNWVGLKRAVVLGRHKMIVDVQNGGAMAFDLAADPGETVDIYEPGTPATDALEGAYQRWLDSVGTR